MQTTSLHPVFQKMLASFVPQATATPTPHCNLSCPERVRLLMALDQIERSAPYVSSAMLASIAAGATEESRQRAARAAQCCTGDCQQGRSCVANPSQS